MNWTLFRNSVGVGFGTALLALVAGVAVALVALAYARLRPAMLVLAAVNLALPPFLSTNAWLDLTANWRALATPETAALRSLPLTALVLATLLWPLTTFLVLGAWAKLQTEQMEAEPLMRGGRLLRGLLLPSARGELGVAFVVTLALALANFTVPTLFQVRVFTEEFWIRFNTQFDTVGALRAAWPLLLLPLALLALMRGREVSWPRRQVALEDGLLRRQLSWLGPVTLAASVAWLAVSLVLPLATLMGTARTWTELPGAVEAGGGALANSVLLATGSATLVVSLALLSARARSYVRAPSSLPILAAGGRAGGWIVFLLPGVFLGVFLIWACNRPALGALYHSLGIVLLALLLRYVAPGHALVAQAFRNSDAELADAARSSGAGPWRVLRDIQWPQVRGGLFAAWYVVYLMCLWDVESVVLIQPPGGETLALRIFNLLHYGHAAQVNALCVVMLGLAIAPLVLWAGWRGISSQLQAPSFGEATKPKQQKATYGQVSRLGFSAWSFFGAWSLVLGAFLVGCSQKSTSDITPLDSKLFSSVQVIGGRGVSPGQFNKPRSLVCDRNDNLYVVDITGRVQKFDPNGHWLLQWQMPQTDLGKPKGMGLDADGNIIVVEPHYMRVNHFTPEGKLVAQWGIKGTNAAEFILPRSIGLNSHGEFFVSEYTLVDRIQRFGPEVLTAAKAVVGKAGSLDPRNYLKGIIGSPGTAEGQFNRAEGLDLDRQDNLFVADSCNHRIQVFSPDGKFLRAYGKAGSNAGELSYPYDIRVDAQGLQYICEFGNSRLSIFDAQDRLVEVIGKAGAEPGRFANPWAIAFDSKGNLYVADSQNHRVQKLMRRAAR
ncbi:MAG TPA: 6-bladed beta-propeller [Candidatus Limnocylindria bacterium]|nr:6-bladed beta-propeller [Candidatus Limnocylindria bacterium]